MANFFDPTTGELIDDRAASLLSPERRGTLQRIEDTPLQTTSSRVTPRTTTTTQPSTTNNNNGNKKGCIWAFVILLIIAAIIAGIYIYNCLYGISK